MRGAPAPNGGVFDTLPLPVCVIVSVPVSVSLQAVSVSVSVSAPARRRTLSEGSDVTGSGTQSPHPGHDPAPALRPPRDRLSALSSSALFPSGRLSSVVFRVRCSFPAAATAQNPVPSPANTACTRRPFCGPHALHAFHHLLADASLSHQCWSGVRPPAG